MNIRNKAHAIFKNMRSMGLLLTGCNQADDIRLKLLFGNSIRVWRCKR